MRCIQTNYNNRMHFDEKWKKIAKKHFAIRTTNGGNIKNLRKYLMQLVEKRNSVILKTLHDLLELVF